ncbi:galactokinase [Dichotomocladium elegans]|nr:galactokinase [Dichotomocladium elegans]
MVLGGGAGEFVLKGLLLHTHAVQLFFFASLPLLVFFSLLLYPSPYHSQSMAANDIIPTFDSLDQVYDTSALAREGPRYNALVEQFTSIYGQKPEFVARSPGRVNLIGEHIDYCGFGVMPMGIEPDTLIAVATTDADSRIRIANVDPKYEAREFDYVGGTEIVEIDATKHEWSNYFKCGYKVIMDGQKDVKPKGLYLLMDGTVPAGSGLSSSASIVCASAVAVVVANKLPFGKQALTEKVITAEHYLGLNNGGMDQTASVFAEKGKALNVEFVPKLVAKPVKLPETQPPLAFVIANTLVTSDKVVTAPRNYNLRVVETRMAALFLSKALKLPKSVDVLKDVHDLYFSNSEDVSLSPADKLGKLLEVALEAFPKDSNNGEGYTLEDVAEMVGLPVQTLHDQYLTRFPVETDYFRLVQRTRHVLSEARRVLLFGDVAKRADANTLKDLGDLMNASQESCDKQFNCSCPEINQICTIALNHGAYGARLTGAGWGGCTVMLTTEDNVPKLIQAIKDEYYAVKFQSLSSKDLDEAVLATKPGSGSAVFVGF